jgi:hypothetical protein
MIENDLMAVLFIVPVEESIFFAVSDGKFKKGL